MVRIGKRPLCRVNNRAIGPISVQDGWVVVVSHDLLDIESCTTFTRRTRSTSA